jgi:hypothetical protein
MSFRFFFLNKFLSFIWLFFLLYLFLFPRL